MYKFLATVHSLNRYLLFLLISLLIINSLIKLINKKNFNKKDNSLSFFTVLTTHIQLGLGIILYLISPLVQFKASVMKNALIRYWTVEHISLMLLAIILITIARIRVKKLKKIESSDYKRHLILFIYNTIALLIISISLLSKMG
jgi:hypothetical protein